MNKINLNSAAFLVLGVFLLLTPALSQAIITSLVTAFFRNIDLLLWVNLAQNFWILNLIPKVVGATIVAGFAWKHLKTRFKVDLPKIKVQTTRLATYSLLFMLCAGLFLFADVPISEAATTATTGYILDTPVSEHAWLIGAYSDGTYYAIEGSTWDNKVAGVGSTAWASYKTNSTKITELVLDSTTSGSIYMKDVAFDMDLFDDIPEDVRVICSYNAEYWEYINNADSSGSPYTVSVGSGVNVGYYLAADSEGRICFTSKNCSYVMTEVINRGKTIIGEGRFYITNTIRLTAPQIYVEGAGSGNAGTELILADGANCDMFQWVQPASSIAVLPSFKHFKCNGNYANQDGGFYCAFNQITTNAAVDPYWEGIWFTLWSGYAIQMKSCWDARIFRCQFEASKTYGICLNSTGEADLHNIVIDNCYFASGSSEEPQGGVIARYNTASSYIAPHQVTITNNVFCGNRGNPWIIPAGKHWIISNNHAFSSATFVQFMYGTMYAIDIQITNNNLELGLNSYGIYNNKTSFAATDLQISGNTFTGQPAYAPISAICLGRTNSTLISDNKFGTLYQSVAYTGYAIDMTGANYNNTIINNKFIGGSFTSGYISSDGGANNIIRNNDFGGVWCSIGTTPDV